jgi:hypothetical protein
MTKSPPREFSDALILHILNVLQPLREIDVVVSLRETPKFSGWGEDLIREQVRSAITDLTAQGFVVQPLNGQFVLTYSGIQALSSKRVAFPRDKHRLYFLKEAQRRRG